MRVRSMVGLIPLFACLVLEDEVMHKLPGFKKRLVWFLENKPELAKQVRNLSVCSVYTSVHLLHVPSDHVPGHART